MAATTPKKGLSQVSLIFAYVLRPRAGVHATDVHIRFFSCGTALFSDGQHPPLNACFLYPHSLLQGTPMGSSEVVCVLGPVVKTFADAHAIVCSEHTLVPVSAVFFYQPLLSVQALPTHTSLVLKRTYGADEVSKHNYSNIVNSTAFAGTIVGMLTFGYLSDRFGRKSGMVRASCLQLMRP